jgi:hypothetical protein
VLLLGGVMHAVGFRSAQPVIDAAHMPPFFTGAYKTLWLADSATLIGIGAIYAWLTFRPADAGRVVKAMLSLPVLATGVLLVTYVWPFFAGPLLLAGGALGLASAGAPTQQSLSNC